MAGISTWATLSWWFSSTKGPQRALTRNWLLPFRALHRRAALEEGRASKRKEDVERRWFWEGYRGMWPKSFVLFCGRMIQRCGIDYENVQDPCFILYIMKALSSVCRSDEESWTTFLVRWIWPWQWRKDPESEKEISAVAQIKQTVLKGNFVVEAPYPKHSNGCTAVKEDLRQSTSSYINKSSKKELLKWKRWLAKANQERMWSLAILSPQSVKCRTMIVGVTYEVARTRSSIGEVCGKTYDASFDNSLFSFRIPNLKKPMHPRCLNF